MVAARCRTFVMAVFVSSAVIALAAWPAATAPQATRTQPGQQPDSDRDPGGAQLIAAAEPFEAVTEQAFTANARKLRSLVDQAEKAARGVEGMLAPDARSALGRQLADIKRAQKAKNRSAVALASVEGYRILVTAAPEGAVPTAVKLMDYAGFRYDANLKSRPARWADMEKAVAFAQEQWGRISGQVSDQNLQTSMSEALKAMRQAAAKKSSKEAQRAVTAQLDLVDKLEQYFNSKPR